MVGPPDKRLKPGRILRQGNLPHKGANCMPVLQIGLEAQEPVVPGAVVVRGGFYCSVLVPANFVVIYFGALIRAAQVPD
ncbi:hypothetical protein D9M68_642420 [compost metagenome]